MRKLLFLQTINPTQTLIIYVSLPKVVSHDRGMFTRLIWWICARINKKVILALYYVILTHVLRGEKYMQWIVPHSGKGKGLLTLTKGQFRFLFILYGFLRIQSAQYLPVSVEVQVCSQQSVKKTRRIFSHWKHMIQKNPLWCQAYSDRNWLIKLMFFAEKKMPRIFYKSQLTDLTSVG